MFDLKWLFFALTGLLPVTAAAETCEMATLARPGDVPGYVSNAEACLEVPPYGYRFDAELERDMVALVNQERLKRGLSELEWREGLLAAARFHSLDMGYNAFSGHNSPKGRTPFDRIALLDRTLITSAAMENVAHRRTVCSDQDGHVVVCDREKFPDQVDLSSALGLLHQGLMDSPGHRANILSEDATHIAIGIAKRDFGIYVTQLFAAPVGEFEEPVPTVVPSGRKLSLPLVLPDWNHEGFARFENGQVVEFSNDTPPQREASIRLGIKAKRKGEKRGSYILTTFLGPKTSTR